MATIVITGAASGIGAATSTRLDRDGHRVIGVDLHDAEVIADLSTAAGRQRMVDDVTRVSGGTVDGLVAAAGVFSHPDPGVVVATNFFGAVATFVGLQPLLARATAPSAIALSSNSTTTQPALGTALPEACLAGDEADAKQLASTLAGEAYAASKLALAWWVRHQAPQAAWAGAGIRLNAIAPGLVLTPMTEGMADVILGLGDVFPIPQRRAGTPEEVAGLLAYLLSAESSFFCGSFIVMDGGTDAALRTRDWPSPLPSR
jgi:NAD(P)-dependent dehydrogenase (short-subunit alcohol dehydrogenase family)